VTDAAREGERIDFTVVIPVCNAEATLAETLDSVAAQTWCAWEAVVVDDGSTDGGAQIAEGYARRDPRFRVVHIPHQGRSAARNRGVATARGALICFLDADDLYLPRYLEEQYRFVVEHPGFSVYSCGVEALWPDGSRSAYFPDDERRVKEILLEDLFIMNRLTIIAVVKREAYEQLNGFRPQVELLEDYDLWLRAAAANLRLVRNPAVLALYRQRPAVSRDERERLLLAQQTALVDLRSATRLPAGARRKLGNALKQLDAAIARDRLEGQLESGRYGGARRLYWAALPTYAVLWKRLLGLAAVTVSPRLFAGLAHARRRALVARAQDSAAGRRGP
jgi:GT2 family glycosyltransferase